MGPTTMHRVVQRQEQQEQQHKKQRTIRSICSGYYEEEEETNNIFIIPSSSSDNDDDSSTAHLKETKPVRCMKHSDNSSKSVGYATDKRKLDRWDEDMELFRRGVDAFFNNQYEESEKIFVEGMNRKPPSSSRERDIRGGFALCYALISATKGIISFADDQLDECYQKLRSAYDITSKDNNSPNWPGKKVILGLTTMEIGAVQIVQRKFLKGIYNIIQSYSYIKCLNSDEVLHYEGREREVIRSAALLTLGAFNLIIGMLPNSSVTKMATWAMGSNDNKDPQDNNNDDNDNNNNLGKDHQKQGLQMIYTCWQEKGILSPWAALVYIGYHIDTKTFLNEKMSPEEVQKLNTVVEWFGNKYPNSVMYTIQHSDAISVVQNNIALSYQIQKKQVNEMKKLPGTLWVYHTKCGVYEMIKGNWYQAGLLFYESMKIYINVGRRSMVPYMGCYTLMNLLQSIHEGKHVQECEEQVDEIVSLLHKYKNMKKKNWGRQDEWAFEIYEDYLQSKKQERNGGNKNGSAELWPFVHLVSIMVLHVRCIWWMSPEDLRQLLHKLEKEEKHRIEQGICDTNHRLFVIVFQLDIYRQLGWNNYLTNDDDRDRHNNKHPTNRQVAAEFLSKAHELESKLTKKQHIEYGITAMVEYYMALYYYDVGDIGNAKNCMKRVIRRGMSYKLYPLLLLKMVTLSKKINNEFYNKNLKTISIPPGKKHVVQIDINTPSSVGSTVVDGNNNNSNVPSNMEKLGSDGADDASISSSSSLRWFWFVNNKQNNSVNFTAEFQPKEQEGNNNTPKSSFVLLQDLQNKKSNGSVEDNNAACVTGTFSTDDSIPQRSDRGTKTGKVILTWDNSLSMLRSKTVRYNVIIPKDGLLYDVVAQ